MRKIMMTAAVAVGMAMTAPAIGQVGAGLVVINLSDISVADRAEIAKDINVNVSDIPVNVQVPVSVAAAICNVPVSVLAQTKTKGDAACSPTAGSDALNSAILRNIKRQR